MLERRMANSFHLRCSTIFLAGAPEVWALKIDPESMQDEFRPFFSGDISAAKEAIAQLKAGNLPVCYNIQMKGAGLLPLRGARRHRVTDHALQGVLQRG